MLNSVTLVGRLVKTPELKKTKTNKSVCSFDLALNKGKEKAKYYRCTVWEKGAEYISQYGEKGNIVGVTGELDYNDYTDKDGHKVRATEIKCNRVQLLSQSQPKETKVEEPTFFNREDVDASGEFKMPEWDDMPWNKE